MPDIIDWVETMMGAPSLTSVRWEGDWIVPSVQPADPKSIIYRLP